MALSDHAFEELKEAVGELIMNLQAKVGAHEALLEKLYVAILSAQSDGEDFIEKQLDELRVAILELGEASLGDADGIGSMSANYTKEFLERLRGKI